MALSPTPAWAMTPSCPGCLPARETLLPPQPGPRVLRPDPTHRGRPASPSGSDPGSSPMLRGKTAVAVELGCITGLLLVAAVPLLQRGVDWFDRPPETALGLFLVGGLALAWRAAVRRAGPDAAAAASVEVVPETERRGRLATALVWLLLGGLALAAFLWPMRLHFWGGWDECIGLRELRVWDVDSDQSLNRPLLLLPACVARLLTPDRIEGFLALAVALCLLNGLLLAAILRRLLP